MILKETIAYTQRKIVGFDLRGIPIYLATTQYYTVYACSPEELKKRVREWQIYLNNDTYVCHRHPRKYVEVMG